jgi:uncharacterized protein involved in outer membrane biogenesis
MRKWIIGAVLIVVLLPLLAAGGAAVWLMNADLRPFAERKLSASLERPVKIGALSIGWGDPLVVDIKDLNIANASWGSTPEMVTLGHVYARIDAMALLHGTLRYQRLDIEKLVVVLERNPQGVGNWKLGSGGGIPMPGPAVVPKNRQQMPTLIDFSMRDSQIRYRTGGSRWLTIDIADSAVKTGGDDQPVTLAAQGAYNDTPAKLQLGGDSFARFREADQPYGMTFSLTNDLNAVNFRGSAMTPLDFDGIKGALSINSKRFGALLKVLDADTPADFPFDIAGDFTRSGDHWQLNGAKGALAANPFAGALTLDEGQRGSPDHIALDLDFDRLLLDSVLDKMGGGGGPSDPGKSKLNLPGQQSPEVKLKLAAAQFQFHKIKLAQVDIAGAVGPGHLSVDRLRFPFAGATLDAKASAKQQGSGSAVTLSASLLGANITDFLRTFDIQTDQIAGKVDASANLSGTGSTLDDLLAGGDGEAVLAMRDGKVSRDVLEKASTDLRTVFRKGKGMSPVDCLLGVAEIKNGIATISPLALRSPDARLIGGGTIDLRKRNVDLVIKSDPKSTGFFALDIPIHVTGPLASPSAEPSSKATLVDPVPARLAPATLQLAQRSGCAS